MADAKASPTSPRPQGRLFDARLLALLALAILSWLPRHAGPIDLRWDGAVYYVLGTSLAEGRGYKLLNEPGEIDADQYPPLLPAVVAAHQMALGTDDPQVVGRWLRLTFFVVFCLFIGATYVLLRAHLSANDALVGSLLCLFLIHTHLLSDFCFPEIPFGLLTVLFVVCHERMQRKLRAGITSALGVVAFALRTVGVALLAAWTAESLVKRRYRDALFRAAVTLLALLGWQAYVSSVESSQAYRRPAYEYQRADYMFYNVSYARNIRLLDPFIPEKGYLSLVTAVRRVGHNVLRMPGAVGESTSTVQGYWFERVEQLTLGRIPGRAVGWLSSLPPVCIGLLTFTGVALLLARRQLLIPLYILLYLAVLCLTPWPAQFPRYLTPLAPFLALSFVTCLRAFKDRFDASASRRTRALGAALVAGVLAVIFAQQLLSLARVYTAEHQRVAYDSGGRTVSYRLFFYRDSYQALDEALDWLKPRAKPEDVVANSMPHWTYLRTGLMAVMPPFEADPAEAQRLIDTVPVEYLILERGQAFDTEPFILPVVQSFPDLWREVYAEPEGRLVIYQRVGARPAARRAPAARP